MQFCYDFPACNFFLLFVNKLWPLPDPHFRFCRKSSRCYPDFQAWTILGKNLINTFFLISTNLLLLFKDHSGETCYEHLSKLVNILLKSIIKIYSFIFSNIHMLQVILQISEHRKLCLDWQRVRLFDYEVASLLYSRIKDLKQAKYIIITRLRFSNHNLY